METETVKKIDAIFERVKEPESGLSIAQLGLIKRVSPKDSSHLWGIRS